ncbi:SpoVG family protein [Anaerotignum propionicum]|uniref:Septation protein SpoVG n=1 Tax=Anaerotignum propionicum DSM 1682 TaxID=991789 RepID=A0A0X1U9D4_ANAPI|nr:SpoVG family protein [Anaerotignum propionicum]AMJ41546.1 putative septation protein SpoVG [Anaerotignum propionicum DSM 1682]SHE71100.1 stage V sporulation protein G [[Clostridium] propionicum DSM 1682] [Anaerotignum propionicum DSM 1682]
MKKNNQLNYDVKIQSIRAEGTLKATATVNINEAFVIRGVKVKDGSKGLFVTMPSYKAGNGEYKDICFPCTAEARKEFDQAVMGAYEQALSQKQEQKQETSTQEQSSAPTMTM